MSLSPRLRLIAGCVFATYVLVSFRVGELFPFARFLMFARADVHGGRLVARTADGREHEIVVFAGWTCSAATEPDDPRCGASYTESEERVRHEIRMRPSTGVAGVPERVDVVRRNIVVTDPEGPLAIQRCPVLHCTAVRVR